jgi:micrococcal nuclease
MGDLIAGAKSIFHSRIRRIVVRAVGIILLAPLRFLSSIGTFSLGSVKGLLAIGLSTLFLIWGCGGSLGTEQQGEQSGAVAGEREKKDEPREPEKLANDKPERNRSRSEPEHQFQPESQKSESEKPERSKPRSSTGTHVYVSRVVDGDTIEVDLRRRTVDVRLIGIDTPETVHPSEPIECFGPAASAFTERSLEGNRVRLEFDVERSDQYGRTLAYVWDEGLLFNRVLVKRGFAQVSTFPPNVKYVGVFTAAQQKARRADRGLWGSCAVANKTAPSSGDRGVANRSGTGGGTRRGGNCDANYKGACIPQYPPDLDCDEISTSGFRSVGSDPHGFDGDGDGVGCE